MRHWFCSGTRTDVFLTNRFHEFVKQSDDSSLIVCGKISVVVSRLSDGGLLHHVGGKLPETSVIREVMEIIKIALELALVLLRILREILGLFQDRKHPRRPDQR